MYVSSPKTPFICRALKGLGLFWKRDATLQHTDLFSMYKLDSLFKEWAFFHVQVGLLYTLVLFGGNAP